MTVIRINNASRARSRRRPRALGPSGRITTGAEPWNVVASPDAKRVFVANSGQDTITVLDAPGRSWSATSTCTRASATRSTRRALPAPRHGGDQDSKRLYVTRFFAFAARAASRPTTTGAGPRSAASTSRRPPPRSTGYKPARLIRWRPQITGFTVDRPATAWRRDSAFPNQLQSIVIQGDHAFLPNIAASPTGPLRFNVDTQAFVNVIDGVNGGNGEREARQVPQPAPRRPQPGGRQEEALLRQPLGDRLRNQRARATPTSSRRAATCWSRSRSAGRQARASRSTPTRPATST